jgi:hypothetical protein
LVTDVEVPGKENTLSILREALGHPLTAVPIIQPETDPEAGALTDLYTLEIVPDDAIPSAFLNGRTVITQSDFPGLIDRVKAEVLAEQPQGDQP